MAEQEEPDSARAFEFHGNWREFAPIAFTNLLLTIVTLGVYTFWARARVRRYLWSNTRFIDDRLEWTGTGLEMFIGYVLAFVVVVLPLGALNFLFQVLTMQGRHEIAVPLLLVIYLLAMYLVGFAIFRALRYRLSRTFWHGIRGGSDSQGFGYGIAHLWKTLAATVLPILLLACASVVGTLLHSPPLALLLLGCAFAASLLIPWMMTSLWNQRWNAMSFGPLEFASNARYNRLLLRYLLYYLLPIVLFIALIAVFAVFGMNPASAGEQLSSNAVTLAVAFYLIFFILFGLVALFYYAAYFREVVSNLSLGDLDFEFDATTSDWFKLMIVNIALVIFTLGIGAIFLSYRNWSFFIRHLNAYGNVNLDTLTQSETRKPGQGEGLLDAFDVGAF